MDPTRVHAYLQAACAGLGFDIGEVWFSANQKGTSTVAAIGKSKMYHETVSPSCAIGRVYRNILLSAILPL